MASYRCFVVFALLFAVENGSSPKFRTAFTSAINPF